MNRQVALLERALSLKKKDGNVDIDLNKLLEENELNDGGPFGMTSESSDSAFEAKRNQHNKKKHHHH